MTIGKAHGKAHKIPVIGPDVAGAAYSRAVTLGGVFAARVGKIPSTVVRLATRLDEWINRYRQARTARLDQGAVSSRARRLVA